MICSKRALLWWGLELQQETRWIVRSICMKTIKNFVTPITPLINTLKLDQRHDEDNHNFASTTFLSILLWCMILSCFFTVFLFALSISFIDSCSFSPLNWVFLISKIWTRDLKWHLRPIITRINLYWLCSMILVHGNGFSATYNPKKWSIMLISI